MEESTIPKPQSALEKWRQPTISMTATITGKSFIESALENFSCMEQETDFHHMHNPLGWGVRAGKTSSQFQKKMQGNEARSICLLASTKAFWVRSRNKTARNRSIAMKFANHQEGTGETPVSSHMKYPLSPSDVQRFFMLYRAYMQTHDMNFNNTNEDTSCRISTTPKSTSWQNN